ncbi:MAG: SprT family zinc-dependent metalloprotease [Methylococcaceae bacterium]
MLSNAYQIRRSARAKLVRIVVSIDKVEVVAPVRMPQQQIAQFVRSKQDWITAAQANVRLKAAAIVRLSPSAYREGALIPYQGSHYVLTLNPTALKRIKVVFDSQFLVSIPTSLDSLNQEVAIKQALTAWMKQAVKVMIMHYVQLHSPRCQLVPRMVRVKTQKSRWGSCSSNNDITINWLLILAPPVILEYVVVHELCHIAVMNHSADFWQLVAQHLPDYQQHRHWLKQHGAGLMQGL